MSMKNKTVRPSNLNKSERERFACEIGKFMRVLHLTPDEAFVLACTVHYEGRRAGVQVEFA